MKIRRFKRGWLGGMVKLKVTSPFGIMRDLRVYKSPRKHNGLDFGVPVGTTIFSPVTGNMTCRMDAKGFGLYVSIDSGDFRFIFAHLSSSAIAVGSSKPVTEGEIIGRTGGLPGNKNSGTSTGAHLHLEVRKNPGRTGASSINPVYWMSDELIGEVKQNTYNNEMIHIPLINSTSTGYHDYEVEISSDSLKKDSETDISDFVDENATEKDVPKDVELVEGLASGVWQITKLLIDNNVANLRIHDAATSVQAGSLISFFNKMCQMPFVEFMGDTYGDQYYFIARRPPFDKDGMFKTMVTQGLFNNNYDVTNDSSSPYEISEGDIINSNLSFNTQDIYSWYQFYPVYELGVPGDLQYIIPAVLFPEYASIWGSRSLCIRSQYRSFLNPVIKDEINSSGKSPQADAEVRHSIHDLKYIIECNAYKPFVRNGTITVMGNRKIKRGMFIRINWSYFSETFYVESVSNSYAVNVGSTNRTTTLTLSHGMVDSYMFNPTNANVKQTEGGEDVSDAISYFNIINFGDYDKNKEHLDMSKWREVISSWKVNTEVFMFFLRKMQLITSAQADVTVNKKL